MSATSFSHTQAWDRDLKMDVCEPGCIVYNISSHLDTTPQSSESDQILRIVILNAYINA